MKDHKKTVPEQLDLFEDSLNDFKNVNLFKQRVQKWALSMGIKISDEMIASWEKFGQDKVIYLMEQVQMRKDINNPIGYITTVLKASAAEKEVAAGAESENMLLYLISSLRRSNEPKPAWFIKDVAIEELQKKFGLEAAVASEIFEDLKAELFKALDIEVPVVKKMSEEELNEKKKEIERLLSSV